MKRKAKVIEIRLHPSEKFPASVLLNTGFSITRNRRVNETFHLANASLHAILHPPPRASKTLSHAE